MARARGRRAIPALAAAAALLGGPCAGTAAELELTTRLESDTAWRLRTPRRIQKSQNRVEVEARIELARGLRLRGLGRVLWDPVARLVGPDPDLGQEPLDRWQVGDSARVEAELRELHLDWSTRWRGARLDLRVGKQQVVWGQSFGVRVLDMVNPLDFREFLLDDFSDSRVPVWGARLDAFVRGVSLQALVFPDFEPDVLPDLEGEFALEPRLEGFLPRLAPGPGGTPLAILDDPEVPNDWRLESWGFGFRARTFAKGFDLSLHYWDRLDPRSSFTRRIVAIPGPAGPLAVNVLEREHFRVRTLGFAFSTVLDDFTLWGEGGLSTGRAFARSDLEGDGIVRRADLEYALGLDWSGWGPLFANLQFIQLALLERDRRVEASPSREFLSVLLRLDLRRQTLFPQLFAIYGLEHDDTWIQPTLEWRATDRLTVTLGADIFTGPREGPFGQFARERECVPTAPPVGPAASAGCPFDPPPGRASRAFLRFRYEISWRP